MTAFTRRSTVEVTLVFIFSQLPLSACVWFEFLLAVGRRRANNKWRDRLLTRRRVSQRIP